MTTEYNKTTIRNAQRFLRYTGLGKDEEPSVLRWLATKRARPGMNDNVTAAMRTGISPARMVAAFREDRHVR